MSEWWRTQHVALESDWAFMWPVALRFYLRPDSSHFWHTSRHATYYTRPKKKRSSCWNFPFQGHLAVLNLRRSTQTMTGIHSVVNKDFITYGRLCRGDMASLSTKVSSTKTQSSALLSSLFLNQECKVARREEEMRRIERSKSGCVARV